MQQQPSTKMMALERRAVSATAAMMTLTAHPSIVAIQASADLTVEVTKLST